MLSKFRIPNSVKYGAGLFLQRRCTKGNYFDLLYFYLIWFGIQCPSSCTSERKKSLPWQLRMLQILDSVLGPRLLQSLPPFSGRGFVQERERCSVPLPHRWLHELQTLHCEYLPWIGTTEKKKNNQFLDKKGLRTINLDSILSTVSPRSPDLFFFFVLCLWLSAENTVIHQLHFHSKKHVNSKYSLTRNYSTKSRKHSVIYMSLRSFSLICSICQVASDSTLTGTPWSLCKHLYWRIPIDFFNAFKYF